MQILKSVICKSPCIDTFIFFIFWMASVSKYTTANVLGGGQLGDIDGNR